jgi:predicted nucleic acid-binding protein
MEHYLIDTNVVSDYLSADLPQRGMRWLDAIVDAVPHLSVITQIELLCWNTDEHTEQRVKNFIADSVILNINSDVILVYTLFR